MGLIPDEEKSIKKRYHLVERAKKNPLEEIITIQNVKEIIILTVARIFSQILDGFKLRIFSNRLHL